jgi:hypothetical protein
VLNEYRKVKNELRATDAQITDLATKLPEYKDLMRCTDEYAAIVAVGAFVRLEERKQSEVKEALAKVVGLYYNRWVSNGADPVVIGNIEMYAAKYPLLDDALSTNTINTTK